MKRLLALLVVACGCQPAMQGPPLVPAPKCDWPQSTEQPPCVGRSIQSDQNLSLALSSALVTLDLRANGQPLLPEAIAPRLLSLSGQAFVRVDLGRPGPQQPYSAKILAGTYRVGMGLDPRSPPACDESILPCGSGPVSVPFTVAQSGVVEVDLSSHQVTGALAFNGVPASECAGLRFTRQDGWSTTATVSTGTFRRRLLPGVYRVELSPPEAGCASWPLTPAVLREGLTVDDDLDLPLDVAVANISGQVTINGAAILGKTAVRVLVKHTGSPVEVGLPVDETGHYAAVVVSGPAQLSYANSAFSDAVPFGVQIVQSCVDLKSGTYDLNVTGLQVQGRVLLDGQAVNRPDSHGSLQVGPTGFLLGNSYSLLLVPGRYSLHYQPTQDPRFQITTAAGWLAPDIDVSGPVVRDLDLSSVQLSGRLTVNGAPPPDAATGRGELGMTRASDTVMTRVAATGSASFSAQVFPGDYDLFFYPSTACQAGQLCTGATLPTTSVSMGQSVDLDVRAAHVTGAVTIDGAAPDACAVVRLQGELFGPSPDLSPTSIDGLLPTARYAAQLEQKCAGTLAQGVYPLWDCQ
jgi:hypothetical protein